MINNTIKGPYSRLYRNSLLKLIIQTKMLLVRVTIFTSALKYKLHASNITIPKMYLRSSYNPYARKSERPLVSGTYQLNYLWF